MRLQKEQSVTIIQKGYLNLGIKNLNSLSYTIFDKGNVTVFIFESLEMSLKLGISIKSSKRSSASRSRTVPVQPCCYPYDVVKIQIKIESVFPHLLLSGKSTHEELKYQNHAQVVENYVTEVNFLELKWELRYLKQLPCFTDINIHIWRR